MKNIFLLTLLAISINALGQENLDKIIKKNGEIIECTVTEVGADEIKYNYPDRPLLIFGIDKALVDIIVFATGETVDVEKSTFNQIDYNANQKQRAIKTGFLKPLNTNFEFTYEQLINPGRTWEASLGIVGIGFDPSDRNPSGTYAKFAYKFIRTPDYYMHRMHYSHILKGAYVAPEIASRYVKYDYNYYDYSSSNWGDYTTERAEDFSLVFTIKLGKQWVFDNFFVIDIFGGIGYGYTTRKEDFDYVNYGFSVFGEDHPLALTSGFRVGIVF